MGLSLGAELGDESVASPSETAVTAAAPGAEDTPWMLSPLLDGRNGSWSDSGIRKTKNAYVYCALTVCHAYGFTRTFFSHTQVYKITQLLSVLGGGHGERVRMLHGRGRERGSDKRAGRERGREDEHAEAKTLSSPRWTAVKPGFEPALSNFETQGLKTVFYWPF